MIALTDIGKVRPSYLIRWTLLNDLAFQFRARHDGVRRGSGSFWPGDPMSGSLELGLAFQDLVDDIRSAQASGGAFAELVGDPVEIACALLQIVEALSEISADFKPALN